MANTRPKIGKSPEPPPAASRPLIAGAYVVQRHTCRQGDHYDFMLDAGAALITFQLPLSLDDLDLDEPVQVQRLADHRRAYLDYEGPVSGGRGCVRVDDRGTYRAEVSKAHRWILQLNGRRGHVVLEMQPSQANAYRLVRTA